tara:strand:- start:584 stop:3640 length:3057 start_codon:yes stop_codon:yes gene_type:complete
MCTFDPGCVDDGNAPNTYTHNQPAATPPFLPNTSVGSPYGPNVMNLSIQEPAGDGSLIGQFDPIAFLGGYGNDDGSCTYNPGCTDDSFAEYYNTIPPAIHDDGTCGTQIITGSLGNLGCMLGQVLNNLTTNYYSNAVLDDGSCIVEACEKPAADNYVCNLVDSIAVGNYCTGWDPLIPGSGTLNILPIANQGQVPINPLSVSQFTPLGDYDPVTNTNPLACKYTTLGCTVLGASNYDPLANAPDPSEPCKFNYCDDNTAFNYNINQPTSIYETAVIAYTSNNLNIANSELCEYIGCSQENIGNPSINATVGNLGLDDGYAVGNGGCVANASAGTTQIPSTAAVGWQTTGLLDPLNTDCCEFLGCYNAGNSTYNQVVGGITTTPAPGDYNSDANVDNGDCKYLGCTDQNASNYFCIANPDVCGGNQGGTPDPGIGMVADDGTCEYNHCADIKAVKCGNPYSVPLPSTIDQPGGGQQAVYDFSCITIDGSLPALGTNDRFLLPNIPPDTPPTIGPVVSEQIKQKIDISDLGSTCYKVVMINPSATGNQIDYPSCVCPDPTFPPTYDCCTFATCPGTFQLNYGPGSAWAIANPGLPTPSVDPNYKFCQERLDGTGQFSTPTDCALECDEEEYKCTCCSLTTGQAISPIPNIVTQAGGGCFTLNSTLFNNCQPSIDPGTGGWQPIEEVCEEIEIFGCTDPMASNYNMFATQDDGSCILPVYGCTDSSAANYDPLATVDDGSCIIPGIGCPGVGNMGGSANTHKCKYCGRCESSPSYRTANLAECDCCDYYKTTSPSTYFCNGCKGDSKLRDSNSYTWSMYGITGNNNKWPIPYRQVLHGYFHDTSTNFFGFSGCAAAQYLYVASNTQYPQLIHPNNNYISSVPGAWGVCENEPFKWECSGFMLEESKINNKNLILEQNKNIDGGDQGLPKNVLDSFRDNLDYNSFSMFVAENPDTWHLGYPRPLNTDIDVDTVEPVDLTIPTEPTGSVEIPLKPTTDVPDTPEITESKKLRKLIKKWRKNNL